MGVYLGTVLTHDLRVGYGNRQLGTSPILPVLSDQWFGTACVSGLHEGVPFILLPLPR